MVLMYILYYMDRAYFDVKKKLNPRKNEENP